MEEALTGEKHQVYKELSEDSEALHPFQDILGPRQASLLSVLQIKHMHCISVLHQATFPVFVSFKGFSPAKCGSTHL